MLDFTFTKPDQELIGNKSLRDPLGFQPIWSTLGRKIVYNLTEVSNNVKAFQLLISTFYLYDLFREKIQNDLNHSDSSLKSKVVGKSSQQIFSLEKFFLIVERAFAYSYRTKYDYWPLAGSRHVETAYNNRQEGISLKTPILQSQLANGVWGYYRSAASRSGLIDITGQTLLPEIKEIMKKNKIYSSRIWKKLFELVEEALTDGEAIFSINGGSNLVQELADIIHKMPEKTMLFNCLLMPVGHKDQLEFARFAREIKNSCGDNWQRIFFTSAQKKFPEYQSNFRNIVECENFIGTLDAVFDWLGQFNGKSISYVADQLDLDLNKLKNVKERFVPIVKNELSKYTFRTDLYLQNIVLDSKKDLILSIIDVHEKVSAQRNSAVWISTTDGGHTIITEMDTRDEELRMTPGNGWINDYYATPLLSIFEGLR